MSKAFYSMLKKHKILFFIAIGILYYFVIKFTDISIPCVFYEITGFKCPGCGITSIIMSLAKLDFKSAFYYNPILFCLFIVWLVFYMFYFFTKTKCLSAKGWLFNVIVYSSIIILLIWGVIRNIYKL